MQQPIFKMIDDNQQVINSVRPFEGDLLKEIRSFYRIGLTYSSNALEGNLLTESETKIILEDGLTVGGKPIRDTFEAIGHARAYDFMFTLLKSRVLTRDEIFTLHRMFYRDIDEEQAGKYRGLPVFITGSKYPVTDWSEIPREMEKLILWIKTERKQYHPVEFAAQLHKRFVFIHPFIDGNGRVARLLMNVALIQDGFIPTIIPPVLRQEYIDMLERAHYNDKMFVEFIATCVLESQKEFMRLVNIKVKNSKNLVDEDEQNECI